MTARNVKSAGASRKRSTSEDVIPKETADLTVETSKRPKRGNALASAPVSGSSSADAATGGNIKLPDQRKGSAGRKKQQEARMTSPGLSSNADSTYSEKSNLSVLFLLLFAFYSHPCLIGRKRTNPVLPESLLPH